MASRSGGIPASSWLDPRVVVGPSAIHGLGLFATSPIRREELVEVLGGTTITDAQVEGSLQRGERYDGIALDADLNLRIEPADWPGIHGNHSCDPNLWMRDAVRVEARRDIAAGEELTVDYALYTVAPGWSLSCRCGSPLCRGLVTGEDWKRPELAARYGAHFAPVVLNRLNELK